MSSYFLAQNTANGGGNYFMIIVFIALIAFSYFAVMRPQKKQQQARVKMMSDLKKGDNVILMSGLHGKVDAVNKDDDTIVLDADGIFLTFSRTSVRKILPAEAVEKKEVEDKKIESADEKKAESVDQTDKSDSDKEK